LPGLSGTFAPRPVPGGRSHECWRLASPAGDLLAKIPDRDPHPGHTARHAAAHRAAHDAGVPSARMIATVGHSPVLGTPLMVMAWIEGTDAGAAWPYLADADQAAVCRGWGEAVARLHAIGAPDFSGYPGASWAQVVTSRAAQLAARHAAVGLLPARQVTSARQAVEREAARLSALVVPALTHLDLHLPNVLTRHRRFAALLDFEHARWWDPAADLVKLDMWVFSQHPQARAPFWDGYAAAGGHLPSAASRLRVCQGLEWLSGLLYWNQVGDPTMYADYEQRLAAWLEGEPVSSDEQILDP
jgi:aminoglycoside phosphotransferase (APT) family kinase protein